MPTLVVKVTAGAEALERCAQGLSVAAAATAAGAEVSLWLTGEAAWLVLPGRAQNLQLPHSPPLGDLIATVLELGRVTVCSQCAARRGIDAAQLLRGAVVAGAATFVAEVLGPDTRALVY